MLTLERLKHGQGTPCPYIFFSLNRIFLINMILFSKICKSGC